MPALAAGRLLPQQSPAAAQLSALPHGRAAELARRTGIAAAYWAVDPRTARPVRLGQPLTSGAPLFPGDPPFHWRVWTTVPKSGYLLEQITSLGTHTGTHISAPCHFHIGARCLGAVGVTVGVGQTTVSVSAPLPVKQPVTPPVTLPPPPPAAVTPPGLP